MRFTVEGIDGVTTWPDNDRVVHAEPTDDIIVKNLPGGNQYAVEVMSHGVVVESYPAVEGTITIPSEIVVNAFVDRISLRLTRDDTAYKGLISFLPESESEVYNIDEFIKQDGTFGSSQSAKRTDFISIESVRDIVITGSTSGTGARICAAYDQNQEFVRILIEGGSYENVHIVPDGTYEYIVASGRNASPRSCILYY